MSGDERAVRSVMHQYISAMGRDDFGRACSVLTSEERARLRDSGRRQVGKPSCADALRVFFGDSYTPEVAQKSRIRSVKITGDRAVVTADNENGTKSYLGKVGGRWLIDSEKVDSYDAETVANKWASQHRRAGETFRPVHCSASDEVGDRLQDEFGCPVRFRPTGRRYVVYLRAANNHEDVEVVGSLPWSEAIQIVPIPQRLE